MTPYQEHLMWMRGWHDGAGRQPMNSEYEDNLRYCEGYGMGQNAARKVSLEKAERIGIKLNKITLQPICSNPPKIT